MKGAQRFLAVSGIIFIVTGLVMGVSTPLTLNKIFGILVQLNELHIFRAMMGVYVALGLLLVYGFFSKNHVHIVLNVELVVLTGLVIGRSYSLLFDGYYHWLSCFLLVVDVILFVLCMGFLLKVTPKSD